MPARLGDLHAHRYRDRRRARGCALAQVETEAAIARETAALILFVVDGRDGLTPVDESLAAELHRSRGTPVVVVVNKLDDEKTAHTESEFAELNFPDVIGTSVAHGLGLPALVAHIDRVLGDAGLTGGTQSLSAVTETPMRIAVVGKPNAGKSSLINAVLKDERTIVSPVAGTTRDSVDVPYSRTDRNYVLIDTAGMRKKTSRDSAVEVFSAMRAQKSIHRAHLCLLVIDCSTAVTAHRTIARAILTASKPCILILNKFDLYHPGASYRARLRGTPGRDRAQASSSTTPRWSRSRRPSASTSTWSSRRSSTSGWRRSRRRCGPEPAD